MKQLRDIKHYASGMTFQVVSGMILLLVLVGFFMCRIGYEQFISSYTQTYTDYAYHTALTALAVIHPDEFDQYLTEGKVQSYQQTQEILEQICHTQNVSLLYVIAPESDYRHFLSIFNIVGDTLPFTPWELGYRRETTNEEYRSIYKRIYENGCNQASIVRTDNLGENEPHITTLIPALGKDGSVKGIVCVQRDMKGLTSALRTYLNRVILITTTLSILVFLFTTFLLKRNFVSPIQRVIKEAERFAIENRPSDGNPLEQTGSIREIQSLSSSIQKMENDTLNYIEHLTSITAEKERISTELNLAQQIQDNSLKDLFPENDQLSLYATMTPAREVGGDFYDFFDIDQDHLCLVMADVSGKGIPAALFMMMSKMLMQNMVLLGGSPGKIMETVNNHICQDNSTDMFVTIWLGILTLSTGKILAVNAGHELPILQKPDGSFERLKAAQSFVVGGLEDMKYKEYEFTLEKGCTLFLYTDGLPEATNAQDELFGMDRLVQSLNGSSHKSSPRELISDMKKDVDAFVGEAPQFDDLTMMAIHRK